MLSFGQRSIFRQGGSFLISLPMQWIKTMNPVNVKIEIDNQQRIIVTSVSAESCRTSGTEGTTPTLKEGACIARYDTQ